VIIVFVYCDIMSVAVSLQVASSNVSICCVLSTSFEFDQVKYKEQATSGIGK
jgi:hypothetical protein